MSSTTASGANSPTTTSGANSRTASGPAFSGPTSAGSTSTGPGSAGTPGTRTAGGNSAWPAVLCWLVVMLEGFDLVVLGAVIPVLLSTAHLGFTAGTATMAATLSLVGVGIGSALVGQITDKFGRRAPILSCVGLFSLFTIFVAFAPNAELFILFRFIAGIGLGAVLPVALAYIGESAKSSNTAKATTITMTGYHTGAVLTALLAIAAGTNWHVLFIGGGVLGLAMVPLLWWKLPESEVFLAAKAERERLAAGGLAVNSAEDLVEAAEETKVGWRALFSGKYAVVTVGVWVACFMGLLVVYGLNTWLPKIMESAGYPVASSLVMLFVLNLGAICGLLVSGWLADNKGTKGVVVVWFGGSAVFLALLSVHMDNAILLNGAIFLTGIFVFSALTLVYAYINAIYPTRMRGTGMGMASGVGRLGGMAGPLLAGGLVTAGLAYPWGFYVFAAVAAIGLVAMAVVPRVGREDAESV